ncbi:MAG: DUF6477 family protein [Pseudomonadota bacterium]
MNSTPDTGTTPPPISRPRLIVGAARKYARLYRRSRDLPRVIPNAASLSNSAVLGMLVEMEGNAESARRHRSPGYRAVRHIELLAALMIERTRQAKASGSAALRWAT